MLDLIRLYFFVFGVLSIAGGAVGFLKAKSRASLIAGAVSGALLGVAGYLIGSGTVQAGLVLGLVLSVALAARFIPTFRKSKKVMPAGLMAILSTIGIVLAAIGLFRH